VAVGGARRAWFEVLGRHAFSSLPDGQITTGTTWIPAWIGDAEEEGARDSSTSRYDLQDPGQQPRIARHRFQPP